jgi:uncharacterized protein YhjY with autotransporter beta-barrel domain
MLGSLSGTGSLTIGDGSTTTTLVLAGNNHTTYSGAVTIDANGTLQLGNGGTSGDPGSNATITDNGTLIIDRSDSPTDNGTVITGNGSLVQEGTGTFTITAADNYSGGTTVNAGTLTVGTGGTLGASAGTLTVNNLNTGAGTAVVLNLSTTEAMTTGSLSGTLATPSSGTNTVTINNGGQLFTVNQTSAGTFAGVIAGSGGFTLGASSTSTLILTGANTYSGGTEISAGTLQLSGSATLGNIAGSLEVNSGGTLNLGGHSQTVGALTIGSGGSTVETLGGSAMLTVSDGASVEGVGNAIDSNVTVAVTGDVNFGPGATLTDDGAVTVTGTMLVGDGTLTGSGSVSGATDVMADMTAGGTINGTGSGLTLDGLVTFSGSGNTSTMSGTVIATDGVTVATGASLANSATVTGSATIDGTLTGTGGSFSGASTLSGGTINLTSGSFGNTLAVTGTSAWNGAGSVTGAVNETSGTFTIGSGADLTATGGLNVSGATLSGSGMVTGTTGVTSGTINGTGSGLTLDGLVTFNGTGNTLSGTETGNVALASSAVVTQTGTLTGTVALGTSATLNGSGTSTVGAVTLAGSDTLSSTGTLHTGGITVNASSTGNVISLGSTLTGAITQDVSSGLTVNGTAGNDALNTSATLSGTGTVGAVTLAGSNTLSSTGTLTTSGITVSGTSNTISTGTVSGPITFSGTSALAVNGTASGTINVGNGATLSGIGSTGAVTLSGGAINLVKANSTVGTLTVGSLSTTGGALTFAIGTSAGSIDNIASGTLTIVSGTTNVTISNLNNAGSQSLVDGNYTLLTYTNGSLPANLDDLSLSTTSLDGQTLSLSTTTLGSVILTVSPVTSTQNFSGTSPTTINIIEGSSTTVPVSTTLGNTSSSTLAVSLNGTTGSGGTVSGLSAVSGSTVGANSSTSVSGTFTAGTVVGTGKTWVITNTDNSATPATISTGGTVNVYNHSAPTLTVATGNNQSIITGGSFTAATVTLADTAGSNPAPLDVNTLSNLTGVTGSGVVLSGGTATYTATGFNTATVGSGKTLAVSLMAGDQQTITGASSLASLNTSFTYNVLGHASGSLSGSTLNLGDVHVGYSGTVTSSNSVTASNAAGFLANLKGSATPTGGVTLTSISGITAGSTSGPITATLATGQGPETFSSQTYTFADDSVLSGASSNVGTDTITVTGEVYSGQSVWNTNGSGSWGTLGTTTGPETFGANWADNGGSPGLDPSFTGVDTATFGTVGGSSAATVSLNAAAPNLNSITFNSSSTSYTLSQGTGTSSITLSGTTPGINVEAGTDIISAPVILATNTNVDVASGQMLTLSGGISGSGGLNMVTGTGKTILSGTDNYAGPTTINAGTLELDGSVTSTVGIGTSGILTGIGTVSGSATLTGNGIITFNTGGSIVGSLTATGGNWNGGGTVDGAVNSISGTFTIGNGADLTATSGVNVTGGSIAGTGTITGNVNYMSSSASTFNGVIGGVGSALTMNGGGSLTLGNTNTYGGGTTISAGSLLVGNPGALGTGPVTQSGGNLGTSGAGGIQINMPAGYTQNGGTLTLQLNAAPVGGLNAANDLVNVTGSATLDGTLAIKFNFVPVKGDMFTVVETTTGVTAAGAGFTTPIVSPAGYQVTGSILPNGDDFSLDVTSTQFALTAQLGGYYTPNRAAILNYIDANVTSGPLFTAITQALGGGNLSSTAADIADQENPEKFGNFAISTIFNNAAFSTQLLDSYFEGQHSPNGDFLVGNGQIDSSGLTVVDPSMDPGLAQVGSQLLAWSPAPFEHGLLSDTADPVMAGVDMKEMKPMAAPDKGYDYDVFVLGNVVLAQDFSQADVPHADTTTGAVQIGADYRITPHLRVGAIFGFGHTDADLDDNGSKATVDSYAPGAFISYAQNGWYANALGSYGFNNFTEDRHLSIGGVTAVAHGAPSGDQIVGDLDGGYDFHLKKWTFGPLAGVQYTHLEVDSFTEDGADALASDEAVGKVETDSLRSRLGVHVSYVFQTGKVLLTPHLDASWQHEFMDQSRGITSQFTSVGAGSFTVDTPQPSRDSALIDGGLSADLNGQVSLYLDYLVQAGQSNYFGQSVQAGAKVGF